MIDFISYRDKSIWEIKVGDCLWVNNTRFVIDKTEDFADFYTKGIHIWFKSGHKKYNYPSMITFISSSINYPMFPRSFELELLKSNAGLLINRDNSFWVSKERITRKNYMSLMKKACDLITDFRYSPFEDKDSMLKYNSRSDVVSYHSII